MKKKNLLARPPNFILGIHNLLPKTLILYSNSFQLFGYYTPRNVLPLHLKQTFLPIIWIFTEGEGDGDGIESSLPFKIFSTLRSMDSNYMGPKQIYFNLIKFGYQKLEIIQKFMNTHHGK